MIGTQFSCDLGCCRPSSCPHLQVTDYKVGDLCPCVSLTCKCVNASIGNVEHWMCGESWLATKDLQPTIPSSHGWASSVLLFLYGLIICFFYVCLCVHVVF